MDRPETLEVLACITPAGQVVFALDELDAERVARNWRADLTPEQRERHKAANTMGGFVQLRMLKEDYERILATNMSARLSREDERP